MKKFKGLMTSVVCLAFCFLCFGCANNSSHLNASQSSSQTAFLTQNQLLGILIVNFVDDNFDNFNTTFILDSISVDENNQIKSSNNFIKSISINGSQNENTLILRSNTTISHSIKTLTQNKFNLEIYAEIFKETKFVSTYFVAEANEKLCISKIGETNTSQNSFSSLNYEANGMFSNSNIFNLSLKFSFDLSSESKYSPKLQVS